MTTPQAPHAAAPPPPPALAASTRKVCVSQHKIAIHLVLLGSCFVASLPSWAAPPETPLPKPNGMRPQAELVRLVRQDCGSCHGLRLTGGLGSPLTAQALAAREMPFASLEATIWHGRPGTAMPAWKSILSPREVTWIAEQLLLGFPEEKE